MKPFAQLVLLFLGLFLAVDAPGADWPQYRYDAGRTAASPEQLPADAASPVGAAPARAAAGLSRRGAAARSTPPTSRSCSGKTMFVPSMVTDSVTALDAETGAERWQFFAEGPVRFAPWRGRASVYFVSDDGYLYCVDAADGKLRWKFRGLPPGKSDRKLLGSGR